MCDKSGDVQLGLGSRWLGSGMRWDESFHSPMEAWRNVGRYIQTKEDCRVQCRHNDSRSSKHTSPWYSVITMGGDRSLSCVCEASHIHRPYALNGKKMLTAGLKLEQIRVTPSWYLSTTGTCNSLVSSREEPMISRAISTSSQCKKIQRYAIGFDFRICFFYPAPVK